MKKGIAEFQRLFAEERTVILRDATQRISNAVVRVSPVGNDPGGEYVAEWDVEIGRWPSDTDQPRDPRRTRTRRRLQETIAQAQYGEAVFFENDDPAALRLELGYSDQAPQGVVRSQSRRWNQFVRGAGRAAQSRLRKRVIEE